MSYDLYFEAGAGKKLDAKSFGAYFRARRHYQVENGQAVYQNEDTGVYFIFDEPQEGVVAFNLNFLRPHVFALEAAGELEKLADARPRNIEYPLNLGDVLERTGDVAGADRAYRRALQVPDAPTASRATASGRLARLHAAPGASQ